MPSKFHYIIKCEQPEVYAQLSHWLNSFGGSPYLPTKGDHDKLPLFQYLDFTQYPSPFSFSKNSPSLSIALLENKEQAYTAYQHGFEHYLWLGATKKEFQGVLEKILGALPPPKAYLCLTSKSEYWQLPLGQILFLKADHNYTEIYLDHGKVQAYHSLKFLEGKLPTSFVRVHRSYLIPIPKLKRIHFGKAFLQLWGWEENLPLGKSYLPKFRERLEHFQRPGH